MRCYNADGRRNAAIFEWYEDEVKGLEQRRTQNLGPEKPVLFYGSSSIRLWDTLSADFPDLPVVNSGFGGSTLAACAYYFERLVTPLQPRSLIFYAGDNDLGDGQMPDAVLASLDALHTKVKEQLGDTPFAFVSIKPSIARFGILDRITAVNDGARELLKQRSQSFYIDISTPMLQNDGHPNPTLFCEDGLHLSPEGYALWSKVLHCYLPRYR